MSELALGHDAPPQSHLWMGGHPRAAVDQALVLVRGDGVNLWDDAGNKYIDAIASLEAVAVGHGRSEIHEAIRAQLAELEFHDTLRYANRRALELADRLAELAPLRNAAVHFASSGSEAVEAALKVVRQHHVIRGDPDRRLIIARRFGYHGCTHGAMALDGGYYRTRPQDFGPLAPPAVFVGPAASVEEFEAAILSAGPETVAAIVIDPAATASGIFPVPAGFWRDLRAVCDRYGVLLVADEVITAFGRTGRWFASAADEDAGPDVITVSKSLSSGYLPISAVLVDARIAAAFDDEPGHSLAHGHTYGGHPVACAAALANLALIEREQLVERAAAAEPVVRSRLDELTAGNLVTDVRGAGLLWGIELKTDPAIDAPHATGQRIVRRLQEKGVLTFLLHPGDVLFLCPPLSISSDELDDLLGRVKDALTDR